jgi:hypothetical protein
VDLRPQFPQKLPSLVMPQKHFQAIVDWLLCVPHIKPHVAL